MMTDFPKIGVISECSFSKDFSRGGASFLIGSQVLLLSYRVANIEMDFLMWLQKIQKHE